jgi:hypothetical protein
MQIKLVLTAALALAAAACSTAPMPESTPAATASASTAVAVNPVGRYEFTTNAQGQTVTGTIEIAGTTGAYTGQITTSHTPPLPISSVLVDGRQVTVSGNASFGPVGMTLNFTDANSFTGSWSMGGDTGELTGRRVP